MYIRIWVDKYSLATTVSRFADDLSLLLGFVVSIISLLPILLTATQLVCYKKYLRGNIYLSMLYELAKSNFYNSVNDNEKAEKDYTINYVNKRG